MLKKRLICCLVLQDQLLVQSFGFNRYLPIGQAKIAVEFMTNWDIDEIVMIDMTATRDGRKPNLDLIESVSRNCFVPLTVGGGIDRLRDIENIIRGGADKVSINSAAFTKPELITPGANFFGSQCIVVSMDAKRMPDGKYQIFSNSGTRPMGVDPVTWAKTVESLGAGEIFLNSIDRDGSRLGYDVELIQQVSSAVKIPVIACGGVGVMKHFVDGIHGGASAVAAGNIFQHLEHSTIIAKSFIQKAKVDIRLSTLAQYTDFLFDDAGRILKKSDSDLDELWLERTTMEAI
jgi:imidazole glycerol-phosphate synthase subunit HisF